MLIACLAAMPLHLLTAAGRMLCAWREAEMGITTTNI